jgi:hypothetical protein
LLVDGVLVDVLAQRVLLIHSVLVDSVLIKQALLIASVLIERALLVDGVQVVQPDLLVNDILVERGPSLVMFSWDENHWMFLTSCSSVIVGSRGHH